MVIMNMEGLNMDIEILNEDGDKILTFKDTHSFHHWVKAQRNTRAQPKGRKEDGGKGKVKGER